MLMTLPIVLVEMMTAMKMIVMAMVMMVIMIMTTVIAAIVRSSNTGAHTRQKHVSEDPACCWPR